MEEKRKKIGTPNSPQQGQKRGSHPEKKKGHSHGKKTWSSEPKVFRAEGSLDGQKKSSEKRGVSERVVEGGGKTEASEEEQDWIFGVHAVRAFLETQAADGEELIVLDQQQKSVAGFVHLAQEAGILVRYRPRSFFDRLLPQSNHQGVALRKRSFVYASFESILEGDAEGALLLLVGIQDPGNVGALLRSARAFGVRAVLLSQRDTCPINRAVHKASVGAAATLPIAQVRKPLDAIAALKEAGWWILGLAPGQEVLEKFDLCRPVVFVLGAEGAGLKPSVQKHCDALLGIPMSEGWDSLNVSVSGGIALYEWQRQERHKNCA